jgi:putative FmdB family regulatory protein
LPTYEYACTACGHRLEAVQKFTDDPLTECPECGAALRKVYGAVGIVLKGSGFYKTDSRAASGSNGSGKKGGDTQSGDSSGGDSTPKKESSASDTSRSDKGASDKGGSDKGGSDKSSSEKGSSGKGGSGNGSSGKQTAPASSTSG